MSVPPGAEQVDTGPSPVPVGPGDLSTQPRAGRLSDKEWRRPRPSTNSHKFGGTRLLWRGGRRGRRRRQQEGPGDKQLALLDLGEVLGDVVIVLGKER